MDDQPSMTPEQRERLRERILATQKEMTPPPGFDLASAAAENVDRFFGRRAIVAFLIGRIVATHAGLLELRKRRDLRQSIHDFKTISAHVVQCRECRKEIVPLLEGMRSVLEVTDEAGL